MPGSAAGAGTPGFVGIGTSTPQTNLQVAGVISPATDNTYTLGSAAYRFTSIYATNSTINTSDVREKKDIENSDFGLEFITKLRPVSYHWKEGADTDLHYGLIAQETEKVVSELKKGKVSDPAHTIVAHDKKTDRYGIKYTELISPVIKAIQELQQMLVGTQTDVASLKIENASKVQKINKLEEENAQKTKEMAELKAYLCAKDPGAQICSH